MCGSGHIKLYSCTVYEIVVGSCVPLAFNLQQSSQFGCLFPLEMAWPISDTEQMAWILI
jgi:hypothetical protein